MKIKNQIFLLSLACITLASCTPVQLVVVDEEIDYSQEIELTGNEYNKLSYLLEGMIDLENDSPDTWNKPLSTDEQKWTFIFNILNNNYMDKYETPEEAPENPYYPILEDSFIPNDWDVHDWVFPVDKEVKVAYKKSDIDQILNDIVWDTLKDWTKIIQDWMILSGEKYLLFTYKYYGSDLIWNKWRATRFEIDSINQASEKDIEIKARYLDDALEDWPNYEENECNLTYHISKNPWSFYGYTVNEYMYTWCKLDPNYIAPDLPSQLVYWIYEWIYSDYITLKHYWEDNVRIYDETHWNPIDLNNDWVEEYFIIWPDSPNWTKILWVNWDIWYNFIYDFENSIVDDYNDLLDWLFVEMYFEDLDWWNDKEVIVVIWDKKTRLEANIYKLWREEWFIKLWKINGRWYLEYDKDLMVIHAPYSNNWVCQKYRVVDWQVFKI